MKNLQGAIFLLLLFLVSCSSSLPKVKPGKIHQRYFSYKDKVLAYSLLPPIGPWRYIEPKYEATSNISFIGQASPGIFIDVEFQISELLVKFNDADAIEASKNFYRTGKFREYSGPNPPTMITVGKQEVRCVDNGSVWQQHYGPSRDPNVSGKWAGRGNTRFTYQVICPFHMDGRHFWFVMDKSYVVPDATTIDGQEVDIQALNDEIDRQFEPVWKSIMFNPALSQTPLPL